MYGGRGGGEEVFLLLSMVPVTHKLQNRHKSSSSKLLLMLEVQRWSSTLSLLPSYFPSEWTAPFLHAVPCFPHPTLTACSISALAAFRGALRRGRVESRGRLQPSFSCCREKRLWRKQHSSSGLFASIKHKTGRPKNK